jgi:hypothetical protein
MVMVLQMVHVTVMAMLLTVLMNVLVQQSLMNAVNVVVLVLM